MILVWPKKPRFPWMTIAVGTACIAVFCATYGDLVVFKKFGFNPARPTLIGAFTYMFLHGSIEHLVWNMLYLLFFGFAVESIMGTLAATVTYFLAGFAGALATLFVRVGANIPVVGASAAISGLIGAFAVAAEEDDLAITIVGVVPVKAPPYVAVAPWALVQIAVVLSPLIRWSSVAFEAHMAGFFVGLAVGLFKKDEKEYEARNRVCTKPIRLEVPKNAGTADDLIKKHPQLISAIDWTKRIGFDGLIRFNYEGKTYVFTYEDLTKAALRSGLKLKAPKKKLFSSNTEEFPSC